MTVELKCPNCRSSEDTIQYVANTTEYFAINSIEDGTVDLGDLVDSYPSPEFHLECVECDTHLETKDGKLVVVVSGQ